MGIYIVNVYISINADTDDEAEAGVSSVLANDVSACVLSSYEVRDAVDTNRHNATDAVQCLVEDFESYLSGEVDPDRESHQCSLDNALMIQHLLEDVRSLGSAIEEGDPQTISDRWLSLKRRVEL